MSDDHAIATQLASAKLGHIRDNLSSGVSAEGVSKGVEDMHNAENGASPAATGEHSQATEMQKKSQGSKDNKKKPKQTQAPQGNSVGVMVTLGLALCLIRDAVQITLGISLFIPLLGLLIMSVAGVIVMIMSIFCLLAFSLDLKFMTFIATNVLGLSSGIKGKAIKKVGNEIIKKLAATLGEALAPVTVIIILNFPFYTYIFWILVGKYRAAPPEDTEIKQLAKNTLKSKASSKVDKTVTQ